MKKLFATYIFACWNFNFMKWNLNHPLYGRSAALERPGGEPSPAFSWGIDDTLEATGLKVFLVRFEAEGRGKDAQLKGPGDELLEFHGSSLRSATSLGAEVQTLSAPS